MIVRSGSVLIESAMLVRCDRFEKRGPMEEKKRRKMDHSLLPFLLSCGLNCWTWEDLDEETPKGGKLIESCGIGRVLSGHRIVSYGIGFDQDRSAPPFWPQQRKINGPSSTLT